MKFIYVLEDGEIVDRVLVNPTMSLVDQVNEMCEDEFFEEYNEVSEEKNGTLYSVSEVEMVFVTDIDTQDYEELFR